MPRISDWFLRLAVLAALIGMGMGVYMGITQNFTQSPVHAHLNLLGWVSMFAYGLFYRLFPEAGAGKVALVHFLLAVVGLVVFVPSLALKLSGSHAGDLGLMIGPLLALAGMIVFAWIVVCATGRRRTAATPIPGE
jgi:hypothetical protein